MAYRSTVHATTTVTPHLVMFGREMIMPLDVMFRCPTSSPSTIGSFTCDLQTTLDDIYTKVRDVTGQAQQRQKRLYDNRMRHRTYRTGDCVMLFCPAVPCDKSPKFHRYWRGPFTVVRCVHDVNYCIRDASNLAAKPVVVHHGRLKPAVSSSLRAPPHQPLVQPSTTTCSTCSLAAAPGALSHPLWPFDKELLASLPVPLQPQPAPPPQPQPPQPPPRPQPEHHIPARFADYELDF